MERRTAPQLTWEAHGSPRVDSCAEGDGHCYVCGGEVARGLPVRKWMGSNFTDHNRIRVPLATHVCEGCCYVSSRTSPVLGRPPKEGKKFGGNFRNYSHLYEEGWASPGYGETGKPGAPYANASKGEKPLIREFLGRQHVGTWFAAIADSGQKHVLPFAPLNGRGRAGRVLFEEALVLVPDDQSLLAAVIDALTWGVTKDELLTGDYRVWSWQSVPSVVRAFESEHGQERGREWFGLAVWLGQRDEEKHAKRRGKKAVGDGDRGGRGGSPGRVRQPAERQPAAELLGANREPVPGGGDHGGKHERVGEQRSARSAGAQPTEQLGLFSS